MLAVAAGFWGSHHSAWHLAATVAVAAAVASSSSCRQLPQQPPNHWSSSCWLKGSRLVVAGTRWSTERVPSIPPPRLPPQALLLPCSFFLLRFLCDDCCDSPSAGDLAWGVCPVTERKGESCEGEESERSCGCMCWCTMPFATLERTRYSVMASHLPTNTSLRRTFV